MKKRNGLKILSFVLEASFIGSILLYVYNYYVASRKYEIIPAEIKARLNTFIIAAIIIFIIFLIVKFVLYVTSANMYEEELEQMQLDLDDKEEKKESTAIEKYKDLEAPVTERVYIYKDQYEIPKNRQIVCPNCNSIIDRNAFICVKCGFLLKNIIQEKIVEKVVEKPVYIHEHKNTKVIKINNKSRLINILINLGLVIAIIVVLLLIINQASIRGII